MVGLQCCILALRYLANYGRERKHQRGARAKAVRDFSVTPDTCVDDAVKMMDEKNIGAVLVMKGNKLVGMLSERDYTRKVMLRGKKSSETKVSEIMSTNLTVTNPSEGVEECLRAMTDKRFSSFAGARWRQSHRRGFDWRPGQARDRQPKRDHRPFGELHQRRIFRIISRLSSLRRSSGPRGL